MSFDAKKYEQLSAYLDGELSAVERAEVERLLARDAEARACLEALQRITGIVSTLPRGRAPGSMVDAVMARVERESLIGSAAPEPVVRMGRWLRPFAMAASLLILATVGFYTIPQLRNLNAPSVTSLTETKRTDSLKETDSAGERVATRETARETPRAEGAAGLRALADRSDTVASVTEKPDDMAVAAPAGIRPAPVESNSNGFGGGRFLQGGGNSPPTDEVAVDLMAAKETDDKAVRSRGMAGFAPAPLTQDMALTGPPVELANRRIDSMLASNTATNFELQRAPVESFDNQLCVEVDDPAVVAKLGVLIETNLNRQSASNLVKVPAEAQVDSKQSFWTLRSGDSAPAQREVTGEQVGYAYKDSERLDDRDRVYVVNVPVEQAVPLLNSMQDFVESNQAVALWTANRMPVAQSRLAEEAMGNFSAQGTSRISLDDASCSNAGADSKKSAKAAVEMPDDGSTQTKTASGSTHEFGQRDAGEAVGRKNESSKGEKQDADEETPALARAENEERQEYAARGAADRDSAPGPVGSTDFATTTRAAGDEYITLAISLRSNPMLRSLRTQKQKTATPAKVVPTAASQPTTKTPPTSQPTTMQGTPRG